MIGVVLICWACTIKPRSPIRAGAVRTSNPTRILSLQLMLIQSNFKEEISFLMDSTLSWG